jgi:hypothetical protein
MQSGIPVRALVIRSTSALSVSKSGAEVLPGDLLDPHLSARLYKVSSGAYFNYPVADGLLEATAIFARAAREASTESVSQHVEASEYSDCPSVRHLQRQLADQIFHWAQAGALHLNAPLL